MQLEVQGLIKVLNQLSHQRSGQILFSGSLSAAQLFFRFCLVLEKSALREKSIQITNFAAVYLKKKFCHEAEIAQSQCPLRKKFSAFSI